MFVMCKVRVRLEDGKEVEVVPHAMNMYEVVSYMDTTNHTLIPKIRIEDRRGGE